MLADKSGTTVPSVAIHIQENHQWQTVNTGDLFANKKVIVFSLPGAYTPTCSSSHLPRFNELAPVFKENGVDLIVCVSVNDTFVMNEWQKGQSAENIMMLPDGSGDFTKAMGMLVDKTAIGFGWRSWRYSMLVNNGMIEKMFIEQENAADPFAVSDADTMLNYINASAKAPKAVLLFARQGCAHCHRAMDLLNKENLSFERVMLDKKTTARALRAVSGKETTPQIFIDGIYIGGADELEQHLNKQNN